MGKSVAILQSNYVPWKGYFDLIRSVDEFILYDDVQYTRRDWRNRNQIKTERGLQWLTIPVKVKGKYTQPIREVEIDDPAWAEKHWQTIVQNYRTAEYFSQMRPALEELYLGCQEALLSQVNFRFLSRICQILEIPTKLTWSMDYEMTGDRTARLVSLCQQAGGTLYLSGPAARVYIEPELFDDAGIELRYMEYSGYPAYPQLYPPFAHNVSVIDLLMNAGANAGHFLQRDPARE